MRIAVALALVALTCVSAGWSSGAGSPQRPFLWQCEQIHLDGAKDACYLRLLRQTVDRSGNPATELPRIDRLARAAGTALYGRCHLLMHTVGREWAAAHHLTIEQLQNVEPRSNDPGCSAGFGMGLVMYLGPQIIATGGKSALPSCVRLPTQYRRYTCVHSLGHALMRGYHETLFLAVGACAKLGARFAADCAQGAFHDYWIALRGADATTSPVHAVRSARALCATYPRFAVACWYRYFIELVPAPSISTGDDVERTCRGLAGAQRAGCIGAASFAVGDETFEQTRLCSRLPAADAVPCLHGVSVQATEGKPAAQRRLLGECGKFPAAARNGCASWFGLTLNLVTNGRFARVCRTLAAGERAACSA
ncbi:MAG: hypothetical protein JWM06_1569, partial [Actinomycetia bacterium]|nr:hypothetical protein [Actinomycetes bacterium]